MLFNSQVFALFILAVVGLYALLRASTARKVLLLVASYLFYAHWDPRYVVLLLLSTLVDFLAGGRMAASDDRAVRRRWLLASLVTNLGVLAVFKYGNFLLGHVEPLVGLAGLELPRLPGEIPVGVSFYTFQTLSYTIDVYRRTTRPCRSPLEFALYVSFFAQLVAGPIVRSGEFLPQVERMRDLRAGEVAAGIQRFLLGLFKKVVIADNAALFVDAVFAAPEQHGAITLWCGAYAFALQIYCDFSGYTDMALGIGRAFNLRLPENFRAPYLASSITDFWRRWHVSLSTWLRDYLYIPLGGSRGAGRTVYRNLMLTMLLGGLWHGAAWTFVAWGGWHGALLAIERALGVGRGDRARPGPLADVARRVLTFHLVCLGWVLFRADGFAAMGTYVGRMFTAFSWTGQGEAPGLRWALVLVLLCTGQYAVARLSLVDRGWCRLPAAVQGLALAGLVLLAAFYAVDEVAFIYFQF